MSAVQGVEMLYWMLVPLNACAIAAFRSGQRVESMKEAGTGYWEVGGRTICTM